MLGALATSAQALEPLEFLLAWLVVVAKTRGDNFDS
jgi:hypothetical protein